jgi:hypothetical protein
MVHEMAAMARVHSTRFLGSAMDQFRAFASNAPPALDRVLSVLYPTAKSAIAAIREAPYSRSALFAKRPIRVARLATESVPLGLLLDPGHAPTRIHLRSFAGLHPLNRRSPSFLPLSFRAS